MAIFIVSIFLFSGAAEIADNTCVVIIFCLNADVLYINTSNEGIMALYGELSGSFSAFAEFSTKRDYSIVAKVHLRSSKGSSLIDVKLSRKLALT